MMQIGVADPINLPYKDVRSGTVSLDYGLILSVERCAPEHGGGVLLCFSHSDEYLAPDSSIIAVGQVDDFILERQRERATARNGRDYTRGVR